MKWRFWIIWWIILCVRYWRLSWSYHQKTWDSYWKSFNKSQRKKNSITFKIETGCYLKLVMPETIKLLGSTKSKITDDKNDETCLI